jgi:hypothetical protein
MGGNYGFHCVRVMNVIITLASRYTEALKLLFNFYKRASLWQPSSLIYVPAM